jgi:hypothetical protein
MLSQVGMFRNNCTQSNRMTRQVEVISLIRRGGLILIMVNGYWGFFGLNENEQDLFHTDRGSDIPPPPNNVLSPSSSAIVVTAVVVPQRRRCNCCRVRRSAFIGSSSAAADAITIIVGLRRQKTLSPYSDLPAFISSSSAAADAITIIIVFLCFCHIITSLDARAFDPQNLQYKIGAVPARP